MDMARMTDREIVELANQFGPGIIGPEIHARAREITVRNPGGAFGPALIATEAPAKADAPAPSTPAKGKKKG